MRLDDDADIVSNNANYKQYFAPTVKQLSTTSISVSISTLGMPLDPASYKVIYQRMTNKTTSAAASVTVNNSSNPKTITGLTAGALYKITTQAIGPAGELGNQLTVYYQMLASDNDIGIIKAGSDPTQKTVNKKSYLELTGGKYSDNKYTIATKEFEAVQSATKTNVLLREGATPASTVYGPSYASQYYYSFGTSILLPKVETTADRQEAGFAFFVKGDSVSIDSGYMILIANSSTAGAQTKDGQKATPVRVLKIVGSKNLKVLPTTQLTDATTLDTVEGGKIIYVNVKVKVYLQKVTIDLYINGFKITATDENNGPSGNIILEPTKKVGVVAASGKCAFDYVYATSIQDKEYLKPDAYNVYTGQFSNDFLENKFGNLTYIANNDNKDLTDTGKYYDEFGTVARELYRTNIKFSSRPSIPNAWATGVSNTTKIVSSTISNFDGEVFVLNNSSTNISLADGDANSLFVYGSTVGSSGELEYSTNPQSEYIYKEPLTYSSTWLQNESDVQSLANWIKSKVVNKAKIINMKVFGNPLVSVGDIITVKYDYQGFTGTEKIIITNVVHSYSKGLETEIRGRTI